MWKLFGTKNIVGIDDRSRPDALLKLKNGYWIGLEYERWPLFSKDSSTGQLSNNGGFLNPIK